MKSSSLLTFRLEIQVRALLVVRKDRRAQGGNQRTRSLETTTTCIKFDVMRRQLLQTHDVNKRHVITVGRGVLCYSRIQLHIQRAGSNVFTLLTDVTTDLRHTQAFTTLASMRPTPSLQRLYRRS